jgi:threonine/homoserine/homoserine lactone efflux protein
VIDAHRLLAFAAAAFALIVVPGPSVLFTISRGVSLGRKAAVVTVLGNSTGVLVQVALLAAGLGSIVARSIAVFNVVKFAGAAYLVHLGVQAFRHRRSLADALGSDTAPRPLGTILREGFVVGISNPKAMVFFAAVLPQFVDPTAGSVALQMILLGLVFVAIATVSDSAWGIAAGTARDWLGQSPRRLATVGGTGGLVIVGLGLRLAFVRHAD